MSRIRYFRLFAAVALGALVLYLSVAAPPKVRAQDVDPAVLALYKGKCQPCHMADGNSKVKNLNFADGEWKNGSSVKEIAKIIADGVPGNTAMKPFKDKLKEDEILALAKYVRSFDKNLKPEDKK